MDAAGETYRLCSVELGDHRPGPVSQDCRDGTDCLVHVSQIIAKSCCGEPKEVGLRVLYALGILRIRGAACIEQAALVFAIACPVQNQLLNALDRSSIYVVPIIDCIEFGPVND